MVATTKQEQDALVRAEVGRRIQSALDHVQAAQLGLELAQQDLSALTFAEVEYEAVGKHRDQVHALWYAVRGVQRRPEVSLDSDARARLLSQVSP